MDRRLKLKGHRLSAAASAATAAAALAAAAIVVWTAGTAHTAAAFPLRSAGGLTLRPASDARPDEAELLPSDGGTGIVLAGGSEDSATDETFIPRTSVSATADTHSPDVALAVNAGVNALNAADGKRRMVVNIVSAQRITTTGGREDDEITFDIILQLKKKGGRLEFQKIKVQQSSGKAGPPPQTLPGTSMAIPMPDPTSFTYNLLEHEIVFSPYSMRSRNFGVLKSARSGGGDSEGEGGNASSVFKALKRVKKKAPIATPPSLL